MEAVPVPTVADCTPADFTRYLTAQDPTPLLVTDSPDVRRSAAVGWTLQGLMDRVGGNTVHVRKIADPAEYREGRRYSIAQMKFRQYCQRLVDGSPEARNYYLAIQNTARVFPELVEDLPNLSLVAKKHSGPFLWFACEGHYEFAHYDADDNFLCPLIGRKHVRMWAPADFSRMYPNKLGSKGRTVQFEVSGDNPDFERHPMARGLKYWDVTVHPGEILFIPAFVIHQVTSLDVCVSQNVFFGDSGENSFVAKLLAGSAMGAFSYWINNIVEQNRCLESWKNVLGYLPRSIKGFLQNQFREIASEEQLRVLCSVIYAHCELDETAMVADRPPDSLSRRNPPVLKIRE